MKRPTVLSIATGPSPAARAEVMQGINELLIFANTPPTDRLRPRATALNYALILMAQGRDVLLSPLTLKQTLSFANLKACVLVGFYHLRTCQECRNWFLATDARTHLCTSRPECAKAVDRRRAVGYRKHERERQARARKATARPRHAK